MAVSRVSEKRPSHQHWARDLAAGKTIRLTSQNKSLAAQTEVVPCVVSQFISALWGGFSSIVLVGDAGLLVKCFKYFLKRLVVVKRSV